MQYAIINFVIVINLGNILFAIKHCYLEVINFIQIIHIISFYQIS